TATRLDSLDFGRGVEIDAGVDFTISLTDGTNLDVDLTTEQTVGDVLDLINATAAAAGAPLQARLAQYGNGIELVDQSSGGGTLTVTRSWPSWAAIGLGLIAEGETTSDPPTAGTLATAVWDDGSDVNNTLRITANVESSDYNGVTIRVHDDGGAVGNVPILSYDAANKIFDVEIENGVTTAANVITELANTPAVAALFTISNEPGSDGSGSLSAADPAWQSVSLSGGQPETLTARDVHRLETEGIFTALLRLYQGLETDDAWTIERAFAMLDAETLDLNFARAELGVRQQGLDALEIQLDDEEVQLRSVLSDEYDADVVEVISNLTMRQVAYEASLVSTGKIFQMSLLDYL
ncbi:MAG: hypothetical protein ACYTG0_17070, partial [Planctomycetota bacterium]